jgi:hypothetical protein
MIPTKDRNICDGPWTTAPGNFPAHYFVSFCSGLSRPSVNLLVTVGRLSIGPCCAISQLLVNARAICHLTPSTQMFPMVQSLVAFYVILDFVGQDVKWLGLKTQPGFIVIYLGGIELHLDDKRPGD